MYPKTIRHSELDQILDRAAQDHESFGAEIQRLAEEYDRLGVDLEVSDPLSWRRRTGQSGDGSRVSLAYQLRAEVEGMATLDREAEARLARRIEFARLRLERALSRAGLETSVLQGGSASAPAAWIFRSGKRDARPDCGFSPEVCRRWMEWHALRLEMVERNLYLVLINVERYAHTSANRSDLIQEGSAALFRAVDGFDWKRGLLFRTYAVHWLNQAFRSHLYNFGNTVRVPVYLQKALKHIQQAIERLGDPDASAERIAAESGLPEHIVSSAIMSARSTRSLDVPIGSDSDSTPLREILVDGEAWDPYSTELEDLSLEDGLAAAMDKLSPRENLVLRKRFGIGGEREHTLSEVAQELGVSLERVRQIQVRAISKMKTPSLRKAVDPFLN